MNNPTPAADTAVLTRLTHECADAVFSGNALWLAARLSHDFVRSNADASRWDRATFLKQAPFTEGFKKVEIDDIRVRLFGASAIVHSRANCTAGDGQSSMGRYTHVWVQSPATPGGWQCVSEDVSRAPVNEVLAPT